MNKELIKVLVNLEVELTELRNEKEKRKETYFEIEKTTRYAYFHGQENGLDLALRRIRKIVEELLGD